VTRTLRAIPTMLRVGLASAVAYRSELLVWILTTNMPLVMLLLWRAVAQEAPVGRFGAEDFTAYFLAALVVRLLTSSWVVWEMTFEVRTGVLGQRLLRPVHPFLSYACDNLAALPLRLVVVLPLAFTAVMMVGRAHLTHDSLQGALVVLAMVGSWAITFCVMAMIGTLSLYWESSLSLHDIWIGLSFVLSGYLMPLELLPPRLFAIVKVLPFRFLLGLPVEMLLGLIDRAETLRGLAMQWSWVAVFLLGAMWAWRRGLARFAAYGG